MFAVGRLVIGAAGGHEALQMGAVEGQLAGLGARPAAEARVVLVGAVLAPDDQLAVGEQRTVRAVRVNLLTCEHEQTQTPKSNIANCV
jgi:hypothetical protein